MASTGTSQAKPKSKSDTTVRTINPATEEVLEEYSQIGNEELKVRLERSHDAFLKWRTRPVKERAGMIAEAAKVMKGRKDSLARLVATEMGKPISQASAEVDKCAWGCEYYAEHGPSFLEPQEVETDAHRSLIRFDPIGPVLAIMPWNFPLWQVFRFAAPTLTAGNTGLLKHAENVTGCAIAIQEVFEEAGFPEGVFTNLVISRDQAARVIESDLVRAVSLTGSVGAGKSVAATASEQIKKCVLELGGSDPFVVFSDAPLDKVVPQAVLGRTQNTGQSCIAAKRFIVEEAIVDEFEKRLVQQCETLRIGDPLDEDTDLGPLAREDLLETLAEQVEKSVEAGAKLRCGGERLAQKGYYYPATVLGDVEPGMVAFDEETFGPVAAIIPARDREHAVELANRTRFGLGASLWTGRPDEAQKWAERIDAGGVFINSIVKSDPRLPFGGVKNSGYGRELSDFGIREFVNIKTVYVDSLED